MNLNQTKPWGGIFFKNSLACLFFRFQKTILFFFLSSPSPSSSSFPLQLLNIFLHIFFSFFYTDIWKKILLLYFFFSCFYRFFIFFSILVFFSIFCFFLFFYCYDFFISFSLCFPFLFSNIFSFSPYHCVCWHCFLHCRWVMHVTSSMSLLFPLLFFCFDLVYETRAEAKRSKKKKEKKT